MKHALFFILLLASCARPPANAPRPPQSEPIAATQPAGDTEFIRTDSDNPAENGPSQQITPGAQAGAEKGFFGKIFGGKSTSTPSKTQNLAGAQAGPRKCKGCTFNIVAGDQQNNTAGKNATAGTGATGGGKAGAPVAGTGGTANNTNKARAPVSNGTGDATDQSGTGAASNIKGDNNAPVLTNAPVEAPDWKAQLAAGFATPVGKALGIVVFACFCYGGYRLWPLLRRKSTSNQT